LFSSSLSPYSDLRTALILSELRPGGMERVVVHLAKGMAERNIQVLVICLEGYGLLASEFKETPVQIVALNSFSGKDLGALWRLRNLLAQFNPSVINLHDYASLPYVAIANILTRHVPLLFTAHGLLYDGFESLKSRNRFFSRFFSGISSVSQKVAQRHQDYLAWSKSIDIIPNGVPQGEWTANAREQTRHELGCGPNDFLFLAVGNPRPEKGFEDLIDAVASIVTARKQIERSFRVVVAGSLVDNDYCKMLLSRVHERQLGDYCKFLGFRQDTGAIYQAADVFVLSSRSEGLPMVILEAMMAGLPVVATKVGGVPDAVGNYVLLVDPASPSGLAQAMDRLMGDKNFALTMGVLGQKYVKETFGVKRMVDDYLDWYRKFIR